jgi:hypothetical protein
MKTQIDTFFTKNSELSMEFSKYVLEHPEIDEMLSEEKVVIFLPEYDPELNEFNKEMSRELEGKGIKVLYVKVKQLSPRISSRLVGVEVG